MIIWYIGQIWDGRQKVKFPIVWVFPDIWKPGLMNGRINIHVSVRKSIAEESKLKPYGEFFAEECVVEPF